MKRQCCIVCILLIVSSTAVCQKKTVRFFAGGTTLNEINAGVYLVDSARKGIVDLELGYLIPFQGEMNYYLQVIKNPFLQLNQTGPVFRIRYRFARSMEHVSGFAASVDIYKLWSGIYIDDAGKHSGSNTSDYSEFKDEIFAVGLNAYFFRSLDGSDENFWFFSAGIKVKSVERTYSVEGTYSNQVASDRTEDLGVYVPSFSAGLRFYL
jgi:hypothetical protein